MCLLAELDVEDLLENQETMYVGTQPPQEVYAAHGVMDPNHP